MHTTVTVQPDISVAPHIDMYDADPNSLFVGISLNAPGGRVSILVRDPAFLENLARSCNEAAVRLSAAVATRADCDARTQAGAA